MDAAGPWQPRGVHGRLFHRVRHQSLLDDEPQGRRLYNAAKKLADCWVEHIGPASAGASAGTPRQEWFDGHQEMEQALVRFGKFVNEVEAGRKGDRYVALAKFL